MATKFIRSGMCPGRLLAAMTLVLSPCVSDGQNTWTLASPDRQCVITIDLSTKGKLSYTAEHHGKPVILKSPLGLKRDDQVFTTGLIFEKAGEPENRPETYELVSGPKIRVDHLLNHRSVEFCNSQKAHLAIDLAASGEGVAFRYRFPDASTNVHVLQRELTGFALSTNSRGWLQPYHAAGPYTPAYEDFYFHVSPGEPPPTSRAPPRGWAFPALFQIPGHGGWALLSESGTDGSYCACHLDSDSTGGLYRTAFPVADETTKGQVFTAGPEPRWKLPWRIPWRVIVMGDTAGDIATSTLITDLAPPGVLADTSWIHPGRASWAWWSYPDAPHTRARFNQFTDFAAEMGWEYTLFDAGWWEPGLKPLADYARAKHVRPLAWMAAKDFYDPRTRKRKLDEVERAEVSGVKVDFWCSDRQESIAAMQALFAEAAARQLVVNLHGCTIPRGWQRTWPNFITAEAVLGIESYMFEPQYTSKAAELNTVLPFTRNVAGPMDATPFGCAPKQYARTTTAAHELAASVIFTSGIIHYAERPEFVRSLPAEAVRLLKDAPARWDETRCLQGEPGKSAVFARRAGRSWFIAGLNGTAELLIVHLDLSPYGPCARRTLLAEGSDPRMEIAASTVPGSPSWPHTLPPRGGFILRLDK
jgi:alpha-glucosidase